ncbi:unnamed protein product [Phaedon cochleariae]|uniref:Nose resistant-to-fluoxetine protein N-terminal domain-containing protein n=1 Tax=Phaedon cochleariae TaxID=80249 RepID=A0A9P0DQT0_PHACE|nr:unnamed protein product [Phaedon cochleariae]
MNHNSKVMLVLLFFLCTSLIGDVKCSFNENDVSQWSIFPPLPVAVSKTANTVCREESDLYLDNLKNFTLWAHEMWDATAKSSSGILRGSVFQMGNFEQCLSARAPFAPQYCLATIKVETASTKSRLDPFSLYYSPYDSVLQKIQRSADPAQQSRDAIKVGWCVPSSCSIRDLETNLNEYLAGVKNKFKHKNVTYTAHFSEKFCQTAAESNYFDAVDISFCFLAVLLITLVILGTTYDVTVNSSKTEEKPLKISRCSRMMMAFSARQNFNELNRADDSNPSLSILYGVRTVCILAIIMDHRFGTFISSAISNFNYLESQYRSSVACLLFHGDLFVDSFFLLSGLLVVYGLLGQFDKRPMNLGLIWLLRYIRLTPVYAFVIFYYATIFNHSGEGPLWKLIAGGDSEDCRKNWWTNLLYISNYVNPDHMCMTHSWYLPCDFHYFIIATVICFLIKKQKRIGLSLLLFFTIASMVVPFAITIVYQRPGLMHFYPEFLTGPKVYVDFLLTYSKSHTRATPYFVGMYAGYTYYKLKGCNKHICRTKSFIVVVVSLCLMLMSVFSAKVFYDPYHPYNAVESASYAALHRLAWAAGSFGVLYVASFGHAGCIRKVLCWSPWVPLSKLVYGAYLCHMTFQLRSAAKFMNPRQVSYFDVMSLSFSDMVLSFVTALGLFLLIEAPFRKVFRELIMPSREPPRKITTTDLPSAGEEEMINNNVNHDSRL